MAHFARVKNGWVHEVIVAEQSFIDGIQHNTDGNWIQTSYNTNRGKHYTEGVLSDDQSKALRKNYASKGMIYDRDRDAFYDPQPFPSWTLNEDSCVWEAPTAYPSDENDYNWNEETKSWDVVESE